MGAQTYESTKQGKNAQDAFNKAVESAQWDYGHAGYTGSIAEKNSFVMIELPEGREAYEYARELIREGDDRIDDKWGPSGCIKIPGDADLYLFFGWASS